jgi:hypothetical protein
MQGSSSNIVLHEEVPAKVVVVRKCILRVNNAQKHPEIILRPFWPNYYDHSNRDVPELDF